MKKLLCSTLVFLLLAGPLAAQQPLPVRRVVLYKNGMAYVVRSGEVRTPLRLTFHPDEMNDVLKTFTAWNPQNSSLYSVGYTTGVPSNQLLGRFPFDLRGENSGLGDFLQQVKGAAVRLDLGTRALTGKLIGVTAEDRSTQPQSQNRDHRLAILVERGAVESVWLSEVKSLEFTDSELREQLRSYLDVLAEGRQDVTKQVTVYPNPAPGPVNVAYVQQFPVWKTSYRLDMNGKEGRIQGWTQIDNPTAESWDNVDLTLVSGMPTSFIMNLYEPLYAQRDTVEAPQTVVAGPRSYEGALSSGPVPRGRGTIYGEAKDETGAALRGVDIVATNSSGNRFQTTSGERGSFELSGLAGGRYTVQASMLGFRTFTTQIDLPTFGKAGVDVRLQVGSVSDQMLLEMPMSLASKSEGPTGAVRVGGGVVPAPAPTATTFQEAGVSQTQDYFEYHFPFPIQLQSRQSALLPFLNKGIKMDRVSIFNATKDKRYPLNGAWIENNSGVPLEPGPVTFFQEGRYAGETVLNYLSKDERRLVSYGVDYDVEVASRLQTQPEVITRVVVRGGVATFTHESSQTTSYQLRNKRTDEKIVILEHPQTGRPLKDVRPDETTANFHRFRLRLAPNQSLEFPVTEVLNRSSTVTMQNINRQTLEGRFSGPEIPAELRANIEKIVVEREKLAEMNREHAKTEASLERISEDQSRVRENLKALDDSREARTLKQTYVDQLQKQESDVTRLRAETEQWSQRIAAQEALVARMVAELKWE